MSPPLSNDPSTMHPIGISAVPSPLDFALRYVFGYPSFRDDQRDIVTAAVSQRDVFVLKSTGGGKSLCFQIPAVIDRGLTVVFSPLLSLLQDQIEALLKRPCGGVPCGFLSSDCVGEFGRWHTEPWDAEEDDGGIGAGRATWRVIGDEAAVYDSGVF